MTNEDIIRMAREAGLAYGSDEKPLGSVTRFAALVAAEEREACAKLCDDAVKMNLETKDYISKTSSPTEGERIFIETAICLAAKQQAEKLANGIRARGEVK